MGREKLQEARAKILTSLPKAAKESAAKKQKGPANMAAAIDKPVEVEVLPDASAAEMDDEALRRESREKEDLDMAEVAAKGEPTEPEETENKRLLKQIMAAARSDEL